jgi:hypothetical protein
METTMKSQPIPADAIATPVPGSDADPKATQNTKKTAEQWATERGHLPEFAPGVPPVNKPKKVMPPVHNPSFAKFRQAFFHSGWVQGQEMTGAEYDAAVEAAANHVYR